MHMDDLYEGWSGLGRVDAQLEGLLRPLATGAAGGYRRFDWDAGAFAETVVIAPVPLLVLEGVGSGSARFEDLQTVLVWVEAPYDVRMARGIARDGDAFAPHWEQWAQDEATLFAREKPRFSLAAMTCTHSNRVARMSPVPSVDPLSTTITSSERRRRSRASESRHSASSALQLKLTMMMDRRG